MNQRLRRILDPFCRLMYRNKPERKNLGQDWCLSSISNLHNHSESWWKLRKQCFELLVGLQIHKLQLFELWNNISFQMALYKNDKTWFSWTICSKTVSQFRQFVQRQFLGRQLVERQFVQRQFVWRQLSEDNLLRDNLSRDNLSEDNLSRGNLSKDNLLIQWHLVQRQHIQRQLVQRQFVQWQFD